AAVADRDAVRARDRDAEATGGAGGGGLGQGTAQVGVERAETVAFAGPLGPAEQRRQRNHQVGGPGKRRRVRSWGWRRTGAVALVLVAGSAVAWPAVVRPAVVGPVFANVRRRAGPRDGADLAGRDSPLRGDAVQQVKVSSGAELVHPGVVWERAGLLVLLRAGAHAGVRGQGLVGGQVAARQGGGAGLLAGHLHPAPVPLRVFAAPGDGVRVDRDGGLLGQLLRLPVVLAGQFGEDHRLGPRGVLVAEQLEGVVYRAGLGTREFAGGQEAGGG